MIGEWKQKNHPDPAPPHPELPNNLGERPEMMTR